MAASAAFFVSTAQACEKGWTEHGRLLKALRIHHEERMASVAVMSNGLILTRTEAPDCGKWSLILTTADGCSMPVMSGYCWEETAKGEAS